jgi:uncharacterized protein (TIGR01777 family)
VGSPNRFFWESTIPHPASEVFAWHTRPGAFNRLNAPWRPVRISHASGSITVGAEVEIRLPVAPGLSIPWRLSHTTYEPPTLFTDQQVKGPFRYWRHSHRFIQQSEASMTMRDEIEYQLPRGLGLANCLVQQELQRLFAFRHALLSADLELHARFRHETRKTILIAGASGFIGQALKAFLTTAGHTVSTLVRRHPCAQDEHFWDPNAGVLAPQVFHGVDAVINLCGENIASGRWTNERKWRIEQSRVLATSLLARTIAALPSPPEVCINASGVGIYGDTGEKCVDESSACGSGFLAQVGTAWEAASLPLAASRCRNVNLRLGMVLNAAGGALASMLPAFYCGVGGRLGSGHQFMSWIGLQDVLGVMEHVLYTGDLSGPVNCVSEYPCTNRDFSAALAAVVRRPALIPAPSFALRAALGEMSQLLLTSSRVHPQRLLESGYRFFHPDLASALRFECGRLR